MATPHQQMTQEQEQKIGRAVVKQANDDSIDNTEPVALRGIIGSVIAFLLMLAIYQGWITTDQSATVKEETEKIINAIVVILPVAMAVWARFKAYSPRSAAEIAVANAAKPIGAMPTLDPPP